MPDNEMTVLRQIMYEPSKCWLCTEYSGDRWLTDDYVLLHVSDYAVFADMADGPLKLTVSAGPVPRDAIPQPDIQRYFEIVSEGPWVFAEPTEWSVAEHPGKAQLWTAEGRPCLLGEPTWTQIRRHNPDVVVEYCERRNLFRFSHSDTHDSGGLRIVNTYDPFAFAAGIRIPDGQEAAAEAISRAI